MFQLKDQLLHRRNINLRLGKAMIEHFITTLIEKWGGGKSDLQNSARIQENFNQTESKFKK
jgi:hypothetical protein